MSMLLNSGFKHRSKQRSLKICGLLILAQKSQKNNKETIPKSRFLCFTFSKWYSLLSRQGWILQFTISYIDVVNAIIETDCL
jgi:hypothetical protein